MDPSTVAGQIVPVVAFLVMLVVGMAISPAEFSGPMADRRSLVVCTAAQLLCLPLIAVATVWLLEPAPMAAAGILVVGLCPSGTRSNLFTLIARGKVLLSVCLTSLSTIAFALLFPVLSLAVLTVRPVAEALEGLSPIVAAAQLGLVVLLPVGIGAALAATWPAAVARWRGRLETMAGALILATLGLAASSARESLGGAFLDVAQVSALFTLGALVTGSVLGALISPGDRATFTIELATRNAAVAVLLSRGALPDSEALAFGIGYFVTQTLIMLSFSLLERLRAGAGAAVAGVPPPPASPSGLSDLPICPPARDADPPRKP